MYSQFAVTGLIIALVGFLMVVSSWPMVRYVNRHFPQDPTVSPNIVAWLARILGVALAMLGLATMFVR